MMFMFQSGLRKYLVITLVMLIAIPCSAKLEIKERLNIETSQSLNTGKSKISCTNYQELKQTAEKQKVKKNALTFLKPSAPESIFIVTYKFKLTDFFKAQKEKIPTYLSIDRFLI